MSQLFCLLGVSNVPGGKFDGNALNLTFSGGQWATSQSEALLPTGGAAFTVMVRVKISSNQTANIIWFGTPGGGSCFYLQIVGNVIYVGNGSVNAVGSFTIDDGNWHTVFGIYDGVSSLKIFIDGGYDGPGATATTTLSYSGHDLVLGARLPSHDIDFTGQLADARIFTGHALGSSDMTTLCNGNLTTTIGTAPTCVWPCNEGSGTTLFDRSGNGNTIAFASGGNAPNWRA